MSFQYLPLGVPLFRGAPGHFGRLRFRLWYLARGNGDSPRGELVRIAGTPAFADGHGNHDATGGMLKRPLWKSKLAHYPCEWLLV